MVEGLAFESESRIQHSIMPCECLGLSTRVRGLRGSAYPAFALFTAQAHFLRMGAHFCVAQGTVILGQGYVGNLIGCVFHDWDDDVEVSAVSRMPAGLYPTLLLEGCLPLHKLVGSSWHPSPGATYPLSEPSNQAMLQPNTSSTSNSPTSSSHNPRLLKSQGLKPHSG